MDAREFQNLQEVLIYVFGPLAGWFIALLVTGGIVSALNIFILSFYRSAQGRGR